MGSQPGAAGLAQRCSVPAPAGPGRSWRVSPGAVSWPSIWHRPGTGLVAFESALAGGPALPVVEVARPTTRESANGGERHGPPVTTQPCVHTAVVTAARRPAWTAARSVAIAAGGRSSLRAQTGRAWLGGRVRRSPVIPLAPRPQIRRPPWKWSPRGHRIERTLLMTDTVRMWLCGVDLQAHSAIDVLRRTAGRSIVTSVGERMGNSISRAERQV